MVAKSYQNYPLVGEPYLVNGRMYVKVNTGKTVRQVRWYTENEYRSMYGESATQEAKKSQKEVLGFAEGYITIFKGETFEKKEELREAGATYTRLWGWSIAGGKEVPGIDGLEPVRLDWSLVGGEDGKCYNEEVIKNAVEPLLYGAGKSTHQGEIGERLRNIPVVVVSCNQFTSNFGDKNVITFEDEYENVYVWFTTTRSLEAGTHWILTGTVKTHNIYKGTAQTTLTRCSLVKND